MPGTCFLVAEIGGSEKHTTDDSQTPKLIVSALAHKHPPSDSRVNKSANQSNKIPELVSL